MPWGRWDDQLYDNGKVASFSDKAYRLWGNSISYANRHLTGGHLSEAQVRILAAPIGATKRTVEELVEKGGWDRIDCGYAIHDFLDFNESPAQVTARRDVRAAAGRAGGVRSGEARRSKAEANASGFGSSKHEAKANPVPVPVPNTHEASIQTEHSLSNGTARAPETAIERARALAVPKPGDEPEALAQREALTRWLISAFHDEDKPPNKAERAKIDQAAGLFYESRVGVDELPRVFAAARERWSDDAEITPLGVARNVTALRSPKVAGTNGHGAKPSNLERSAANLRALRQLEGHDDDRSSRDDLGAPARGLPGPSGRGADAEALPRSLARPPLARRAH